MNSSPSFTVVIPLYNKEQYITRSIDSILGQSVEDFEVIVVDDGSTDASVRKVKKYTDDRIILIEQKNAGAAAARNMGIHNAKGKYIAFLDADDVWLSDYLETITKLIEKYPTAGAYSTSFKIKKVNGSFEKRLIDPLPYHVEWDGIIPNYFHHLHMSNTAFCTNTICVKKEVFSAIGDFQTDLKRGEDLDMWIRIFFNYNIIFSSKEKAIYFLEASSMKGKDEELHRGEQHLADYWQTVLDSGIVEERFYKDFQKYVNKKYIALAQFYLKRKNKKAAIEVLRNDKLIDYKAKKYFLVLFTTVLPVTIYSSYFSIKQNMKQQIKKIIYKRENK